MLYDKIIKISFLDFYFVKISLRVFYFVKNKILSWFLFDFYYIIYRSLYIYLYYMKKFDSIIIWFGKGGKTLAANLAKKGEKIALIEKESEMYGGTCINRGCIPSKKLIELSQEAHSNDKFSHYPEIIEEKNQLISFLRQKNFEMLDTLETVTIFNGQASFVDNHQIKIQWANEEIIFGEKIFINTGATPQKTTISGLETSKLCYTSADLMNLSKLPERLVIMGAGYIGLEFASMYADLGAKVTLINKHSDILPNEEPEIVALIKKNFESRGITILNTSKIIEGKEEKKSDFETFLTLEIQTGESQIQLQADGILLATGRIPNIEGLELENAGVKVSEKGAIIVNDKLQTSQDHIWAMGDVNGGPQFTYISLDDFRIVFDQLYGTGTRSIKDRNSVAYSLFLTPNFARVGLSESDAKKQGLNYKVFSLPVAAIPKARILKKTDGLFKAIVDSESHQILWASLLWVQAPELINIISFAMKHQLPYESIRDHIFTHPTISESLNDLFKG